MNTQRLQNSPVGEGIAVAGKGDGMEELNKLVIENFWEVTQHQHPLKSGYDPEI